MDRESPEYKKAVKRVKARDGNKCQHPGCWRRRRLQVHHIIRYADAPSLQVNEKNLITLCSRHHYMVRNNEGYWIELYSEIVREKYEDNN